MKIRLIKSPSEISPPEMRMEKSSVEDLSNTAIGTEFEVLGIMYEKETGIDRIQYFITVAKSEWSRVSSWYFEITDGTIPSHWIVNSWPQYRTPLVIGPWYIARSVTDYDDFMSSEPEQKKAYYEDLKALGLYKLS